MVLGCGADLPVDSSVCSRVAADLPRGFVFRCAVSGPSTSGLAPGGFKLPGTGVFEAIERGHIEIATGHFGGASGTPTHVGLHIRSFRPVVLAALPPRHAAAPPCPRPTPPIRRSVSLLYSLAGPGQGGALSPRRIVHRQFQSAPSKNSRMRHPKADSICRRTMKSQTHPIAGMKNRERPGKRVANRGPFQLASGNPKAAPGQIGPANTAHQSEQWQFSRGSPAILVRHQGSRAAIAPVEACRAKKWRAYPAMARIAEHKWRDSLGWLFCNANSGAIQHEGGIFRYGISLESFQAWRGRFGDSC